MSISVPGSLPTLDTSRLRLVPYDAGLIDDLHRLWIDPGVRRYLWDDQVISRERAGEAIEADRVCVERHGFGQWALFLRDRPGLIGFCGFRAFEEKAADAELLYGLLPDFWGKGLAVEAARACLKWAFEVRRLRAVVGITDPPNHASIRVMEKLGMQFLERSLFHGLEAIYYVITAPTDPT